MRPGSPANELYIGWLLGPGYKATMVCVPCDLKISSTERRQEATPRSSSWFSAPSIIRPKLHKIKNLEITGLALGRASVKPQL